MSSLQFSTFCRTQAIICSSQNLPYDHNCRHRRIISHSAEQKNTTGHRKSHSSSLYETHIHMHICLNNSTHVPASSVVQLLCMSVDDFSCSLTLVLPSFR